MSEHNYFGLLVKDQLAKHPEVFTITDVDIIKVQQNQAVRRAAQDADRPSEPVRTEFNRLRKELFTLQQTAKSFETKVNNLAGNVLLFEERIATTLQSKKECSTAGNLLGERTYEHQVTSLEEELQDTRERLVKEQRYSSAAGRELRAWQQQHAARLEELQKLVG